MDFDGKKMQKRAARFADTLETKKPRTEPLTLQINAYAVSKYSIN